MDKLIVLVCESLGVDQKVSLGPATRLRDIPGWDSMNSVNLEMSLEAEYSMDREKLSLTDDTTLAELYAKLPAQ